MGLGMRPRAWHHCPGHNFQHVTSGFLFVGGLRERVERRTHDQMGWDFTTDLDERGGYSPGKLGKGRTMEAGWETGCGIYLVFQRY